MRFQPITSEQADEQAAGINFEPWPPGEYDFDVYDCSEEISAAGSEMFKLTLHVHHRDGRRRTVFDYLLFTDKAQWKLRHFAEATGMLRQYETGNIQTHDVVNRMGRLKLRIKPAKDNYPANNQVGDYIKAAGQTASGGRPAARPTQRPETVGETLDDEIPFLLCDETYIGSRMNKLVF